MDSWERMIIQTGKPRAMRTATVVEDHDKQCYDFYLRIETLRIAIENDIDATSPRGGNDTMLGSKVDSYDGHDDRSIFFSNNNKMTSLSAMILDYWCRKCCGCGCCVCSVCVVKRSLPSSNPRERFPWRRDGELPVVCPSSGHDSHEFLHHQSPSPTERQCAATHQIWRS